MKILSHEGYDGWIFSYTALHKRAKAKVWLHELAIELFKPIREEHQVTYPDHARTEASGVAEEFMQEAAALHQTEALCVGQITKSWKENETVYVEEMYWKGISLKDRLARTGAFPEKEAIELLDHVTDGITSLHTAGIYHCQLTPASIWLTDEGLSLVRGIGQTKQNFYRRHGKHLDKLPSSYSALELFRPNSPCSVKSDIYSIGAVAYQLVTNARPEASTRRVENPMAEAQHFAPISDHLNEVFMKALSLKPEDRHGDVKKLYEDLTKNHKPKPRPPMDLSEETVAANRIFWIAGLIALGIMAGLVWLSLVS
jgi:serine/threonine protein kinase